jgi:hypothetical protein
MDLILNHSATEHGCCGGVKDDSEAQKPDDDCCQSVCNPFQKCNSCTIAFVNTYFSYSCKFFDCSPAGTEVTESFISQFESDFWQPPKQA